METEILRSREFWEDVTPVAMGDLPFGHGRLAEIPELVGHVLFETSGSTGAPQWVALSKDALLESARGVNAHLRVDGGSCWGLALPLRHVGGFGVVARAYQAGCGFREFGQRWNPEAFRDWIVNERVSHCSLVPTQVHDLAAAGLRAPDSLVAVVVGGGHLPAAAGRAARDLGWPVLASYGMTEAGSQIATQGLDALDDIYQPVPIPLLPLWRAGVTPGGCLWISGPALFSGIFTPSPAGGIFTARAGDGFETRDRVEIRAGWLVPLGRADSCVKVLGELVDTMEIEREVNRLSGGRLPPGTMVVVPVPDARTEHLLVPVFDSSVDKQLAEESLAAYHAQAAGFRRLQAPVWMDELPRSPLGKPRRAEIADRLRKALAGDSKSRSMSRLTFLIIALSVPALVRSADAMTPPGLPTADAIAAGLAAQPQRAAAAAARVRPALERDLARLGLTPGHLV